MSAIVHWQGPQGTTLYSQDTGRSCTLAAPTARLALEHPERLMPPVVRRLEALGLLGDLDLTLWVVCRHQATLLLPDLPALWAPNPIEHGAGGPSYRALPLTPRELRLWRGVNDSRTLQAVAAEAGVPVAEARRFFARLTPHTVQAVQLRRRPPRAADLGLQRLVGPPRAKNTRTIDQHGAHGQTTLSGYHLHSITDGATHFDDRETTVAHALALPHPGLHLLPYGQQLRRRLGAQGFPVEGAVVEVGAGTGELAAAWLKEGPVPYTRVDLSPELLRTQAQVAPSSGGVLADGTQLPLRSGEVPLLISNEVLADLEAVPVGAQDPRVEAMRRQYGLDRPRTGWDNLGAWRMVAEVCRVLAPGGRAYLSEFGTASGPAEEAVQLDHPEVSVRFEPLTQIAEAHGMHVRLIRLDELLDLDLRAPQVSRISWRALRARAAALKTRLPARCWTPESLNAMLPFQAEGVHFTPLADEGPGPLITRFQALLIERPS